MPAKRVKSFPLNVQMSQNKIKPCQQFFFYRLHITCGICTQCNKFANNRERNVREH